MFKCGLCFHLESSQLKKYDLTFMTNTEENTNNKYGNSSNTRFTNF